MHSPLPHHRFLKKSLRPNTILLILVAKQEITNYYNGESNGKAKWKMKWKLGNMLGSYCGYIG